MRWARWAATEEAPAAVVSCSVARRSSTQRSTSAWSDPSLQHMNAPKPQCLHGCTCGPLCLTGVSGIVIAGVSIDIEVDPVRPALEGLDPKTITSRIPGPGCRQCRGSDPIEKKRLSGG